MLKLNCLMISRNTTLTLKKTNEPESTKQLVLTKLAVASSDKRFNHQQGPGYIMNLRFWTRSHGKCYYSSGWSYLVPSVLPAVSHKKTFLRTPCNESFIDQVCSESRWMDIGLLHFCVFMDLDAVSMHKHAKRNLANLDRTITHAFINTSRLNELV